MRLLIRKTLPSVFCIGGNTPLTLSNHHNLKTPYASQNSPSSPPSSSFFSSSFSTSPWTAVDVVLVQVRGEQEKDRCWQRYRGLGRCRVGMVVVLRMKG